MKTDIIVSCEERCHKLLEEAFNITYEHNPLRITWGFDDVINTDVVINCPEDVNPEEYYLVNLYLSDTLQDELYNIVEGFPVWLNIYRSGRTSIDKLLNYYTPEHLEMHLEKHEVSLNAIVECRNEFIKKQKKQ